MRACLGWHLVIGSTTPAQMPAVMDPTTLTIRLFLGLLRDQLAEDRGPDADSTPLYLSGSVGSLFKIRLSAHGYTLVAKGVEAGDLPRLHHENKVYSHLRSIQGTHVPVCLGLIDPVLPFYYDGGIYEHFILLSWAGRPLSKCINPIQIGKTIAVNQITKAFTELHRLGVCHRDAEMRNILYDQGFMIVDFERAEFCGRPPLGPISPNGQDRKRKRPKRQKEGNDTLAGELRLVVESVSKYFDTSRSSCQTTWTSRRMVPAGTS